MATNDRGVHAASRLVGLLEADDLHTFTTEEISELHDIFVLDDTSDILREGLRRDARLIETVLKHARDASKEEEVLDEYLDRIGVTLTQDEWRAASSVLQSVHWKQASRNSKKPKEVPPQSSRYAFESSCRVRSLLSLA